MIKKIVLASASPRRKEILEMLGIQVTVRLGNYEENMEQCQNPQELVTMLAKQKAAAVSRTKEELILAADTIVTIYNQILGKPKDAEDAAAMLSSLSGKEHSVFTGFCLLKGDRILTGVEETKVKFRVLNDTMIAEYLKTGEPFDKAGAYGIQGKGCLLIESICGDYFNVVGLPISRIMAEINGAKL